MNTYDIPASMKAMRVNTPVPAEALVDPDALARHVEIVELDVPVPGPGEVLVKIGRGTINPNELYHLQGVYSATKDIPFPRPLGFEGAGVVVASGGGLVGRFRVGSRVAFYAMGMYAEYVVCKALDLIDIPADVALSAAACSVGNPLTAMVMLEVAQAAGSKHVINTAAASALGRLLIRVGKTVGIDMICVVRRDEQMEICRREGATHVLNSSAPDFDAELAKVCAETDCSFAYDCTAGDMPARLLAALPDHGTLMIYGYLTPGPIQLMPQVLFPEKRLAAFEIDAYLSRKSLLSKFLMVRRLSQGMGTVFKSEVAKAFPLSEGIQAISYFSRNMTAGKVQIVADATL